MRNLNFLAKILNTSYYLFFTLFLCVISYLTLESYNKYTNGETIALYYNLFILFGVIIYLSLIAKLKNKIEQVIYKTNYEQVLIPLIIQAILYGVITPFAFVNYYVIYMLVANNNTDFLKNMVNKNNKYYIAYILLYVGFIVYVIYMFVKYVNIMLDVIEKLVNRDLNFSFSFLFSFFMLVVWLILIRIAIKLYNENKFIESAVISIVVGILTNPFNVHSLCLIASGVIILIQDHNFEQITGRLNDIKEKINKK